MKQGELVWLWMALVILGAVTVLAYRSIDSAADTLGWVEHTGKVLQQISEVTAAYSRAVTARRAYVVAGDDSQLADVRDLDERLGRAIGAERASLADNPSQLRSLEAMSRLLEERLSSLDASVAQRRREGVGVETAEGFALTAQIRTIREKMEGEENRLLAERDALTRRDMARTKFAEIIGTLASFAILLFAFNRLRREIARRQQTEQALVASQSFLDSIVENIPNMIFVKEAGELRFERINRAGEQLLGVKRADLVRKNDFDLFPREQAEFFQERDRETLNNKIPVDIAEEPIKTARGERWLHTKKVPVLDAEGVPKYLLGISEDITEQRQAAEALKSAKDAAEAANHELEAFSYSVAHDLRAPLRGINGYSVALVEDIGDKLDGEAKDYLQRIGAGATRMGQLIDALLGLSRVSRADLVREPVNVTEMASYVLKATPCSSARCSRTCSAMRGSSRRSSNARASKLGALSTRARWRILSATTARDSTWSMRGSSLRPSNACINQPNFPAPVSGWRPFRESSGGTVVRSGRRDTSGAERPSTSRSMTRVRRKAWTMASNKVILLVEDNYDDEVLTLRALKKSHIANEVVVAHDGVEALDYIFGTGVHAGRDVTIQPQVVLLDLNLPRIGGLEVLKRLRAVERTRFLPVVVLTSSKEDEDMMKSYANGANAYVSKPVEFDAFSEAVKTLGLFWLLLNEIAPPPRRPL